MVSCHSNRLQRILHTIGGTQLWIQLGTSFYTQLCIQVCVLHSNTYLHRLRLIIRICYHEILMLKGHSRCKCKLQKPSLTANHYIHNSKYIISNAIYGNNNNIGERLLRTHTCRPNLMYSIYYDAELRYVCIVEIFQVGYQVTFMLWWSKQQQQCWSKISAK